MKKKMQNAIRLFCTACLSGILATGCGTAPASADGQVAALPSSADSGSTAPSQPETSPDSTAADNSGDTPNAETTQADTGSDNTDGRWHVFPPDVAAAVDADFAGDVRKIGENTFYIAEEQIMLLEDGSIAGSSPASDVTVPESDLVQVAYDETTHFYLWTIYNGETHEDTEASSQDLALTQSVELKGSFENDVFHASEVRIIKVS